MGTELEQQVVLGDFVLVDIGVFPEVVVDRHDRCERQDLDRCITDASPVAKAEGRADRFRQRHAVLTLPREDRVGGNAAVDLGIDHAGGKIPVLISGAVFRPESYEVDHINLAQLR